MFLPFQGGGQEGDGGSWGDKYVFSIIDSQVSEGELYYFKVRIFHVAFCIGLWPIFQTSESTILMTILRRCL